MHAPKPGVACEARHCLHAGCHPSPIATLLGTPAEKHTPQTTAPPPPKLHGRWAAPKLQLAARMRPIIMPEARLTCCCCAACCPPSFHVHKHGGAPRQAVLTSLLHAPQSTARVGTRYRRCGSMLAPSRGGAASGGVIHGACRVVRAQQGRKSPGPVPLPAHKPARSLEGSSLHAPPPLLVALLSRAPRPTHLRWTPPCRPPARPCP